MDAYERDLRIDLIKTLNEIEQLIEAVEDVAKEVGCTPYELKDTMGHFLLTPLVCNKAAILHALSLLNTKEQ